MPLVIEDGSIVANANTYIDVAYLQTYASDRGKVISSDNDVLEASIIKANDYLESKRDSFKGYKVSETQSLQFPRYNVYVDNILLSYESIPDILKKAQAELAIEAQSGENLLPTTKANSFIKKEAIGPIETQYSENLGTSRIMHAVEAVLLPLFRSSVGSTRTLRV